MFKFLKEKLKTAVSKFSKKVEEEVEEEPTDEIEESIEKEKPKIEKKGKKKKTTTKKDKKEKKRKEEKESDKKEKKKKEKTAKKKKEPSENKNSQNEKEKLEEKKESSKEEFIEQPIEDEKPKKGFFSKIFKKKEKEDEEAPEKQVELPLEEKEKTEDEETPEEEKEKPKKGFFKKIGEKFTTKTISDTKFEDLFNELEITLLENNVAIQVIDKIKSDMKDKIVGVPLPRGKITETIINSLKESIKSLFDIPKIDILKAIKEKSEKPYVISFVGVNGSGKTTSLAKIANLCLKNELEPVMVAADTFRAAAIQQLEEHANNLKIKIIKHDYGSDAAAVAYDGIEHAKSKGKDVVLVDTAGRLHSNTNLMDELKKVQRVAKPDLTIFVGESITGNDCTEQAIKFNESVEIDAIILTKADVDEKGGASISVSYVTGKPIIFIGTGQEYKDLEEFNSKKVLETLGL